MARALTTIALLVALAAPAPAGASAMRDVIVVLRAPPAGSAGAALPLDVERWLARDAAATYAALRATVAASPPGAVARVVPLPIAQALAVRATPRAIAALRHSPDVLAVRPDRLLAVAPSPVAGTPSPNVAAIGAPALWALGALGQGVTVAVLDTGVDAAAPALTGRLRPGPGGWFDPYGEHDLPADPRGHGTLVASVLAGDGGIGVAPGAQLIATRVFDDRGRARESAIHAAFQWLLDPDGDPDTDDAPRIVNGSWTFAAPGCHQAFARDVAALLAAGILPVFAAGPGGSSFSPANYRGSLAVGASDARGPARVAACDAHRSYPDLLAPGASVIVADGAGDRDADGSSLAAPHVAAAAALLAGRHPAASGDALRAALVGGSGGTVDVGAADAWLSAAVDIAAPSIGDVSVRRGRLRTVVQDASGVAEVHVALDGAMATARPMRAGDGRFDGLQETAELELRWLSPGPHRVWIAASDRLGHGTRLVSRVVLVDRAGPRVLAASALAPPNGRRGVLVVTGRDPANGSAGPGVVVGGEWWTGRDPGAGHARALAPGPGAARTFLGRGVRCGPRVLHVRLRDAAANWGAPRAVRPCTTGLYR